MEDRLMTIKQLASYLNVQEQTVLKLVQDGSIPGLKIGNQWRFRKPMIDAWLDDQMLGITPRYVELTLPAVPYRMLTLESSFNATHIKSELEGKTKTSIIVELADHAQKLGLVSDETWFTGALIQRENIMPSAVGNGLAILHTLRRHPERVTKPFMVFGRSRDGVDFDALDGRPTHLFIVLGLRYDELHLPWLTKFVQILAQPEILSTLLQATDTGTIYDLLIDIERKMEPALPKGG